MYPTTIELDNREPFKIEGTIWEAYSDEMQSLGIQFPEKRGNNIFTFRVPLNDEVHQHFFFLRWKGEVLLLRPNENLTFSSPRELLDYFKSPQCSREHILAMQEAERKLMEAEAQDQGRNSAIPSDLSLN